MMIDQISSLDLRKTRTAHDVFTAQAKVLAQTLLVFSLLLLTLKLWNIMWLCIGNKL